MITLLVRVHPRGKVGKVSKVNLSTAYGSFGGGLTMWFDEIQREVTNNIDRYWNSIYPNMADCWLVRSDEILQNLNENNY